MQVSSIKYSDYRHKVKTHKKDHKPEFFAMEAEGFPGKEEPVYTQGDTKNGIQ
jgi:hypothetical protein